jgi:hypothetical protein
VPVFGGRPHVEVEAVFAHAVGAEIHVAEDGALHGPGTELVGLADAGPVLRRLGFFQRRFAHGRGGKRNALEGPHAALFGNAFHDAIGRFYAVDPAGSGFSGLGRYHLHEAHGGNQQYNDFFHRRRGKEMRKGKVKNYGT